jgi:hypothetical protein
MRDTLAPEAMMSAFRHEHEKGAGTEPPTQPVSRLSRGASILVIVVLAVGCWAVLLLIALLYAIF